MSKIFILKIQTRSKLNRVSFTISKTSIDSMSVKTKSITITSTPPASSNYAV